MRMATLASRTRRSVLSNLRPPFTRVCFNVFASGRGSPPAKGAGGETHIARFEARMHVPFCVEKLCRVLFFCGEEGSSRWRFVVVFSFSVLAGLFLFFWQNLAAKISGSRFRITLWKWSQARVFFFVFSFLFRACVCVRVLC